MGILSRLGSWRLDDGVAPLATAADATVSWLQLGGGGDVAQVRDLPAGVAAAFGLSAGEGIDRASAMRIPTIRRARSVIAGTIGAQPLVAHRRQPDGQVVDVTADRQLLVQPNPNTTRQYELTWTIDDLWFRGLCWWRVLARDAQRYPTQAERIAPERVTVDLNARRVYVDGVDSTRDMVRFDGPDEGLLAYAGSVLSTSRQLTAAVRRAAADDIPLAVLRLAEGGTELSSEAGSANDGTDRSEVDALLDGWEDARRTRSTAYLNRAVEATFPQKDARSSQLAEQREAQRIDEANMANVPPRVVNAPSAQPMTYSNAVAERADLVDTSLAPYLVAVEQRLSMGDVTPRGTVVRFDLSRYLSGDTLSALQAAEVAERLGAITGDEVRADVLGRAPLTDEQRRQLRAAPAAPAPAPEAAP